MEQEYRHAIALMRYSAIAPIIPGLPEGYKNLSDYLEQASRKGLVHPDGKVRNYAPKTLYKWYFCCYPFFPTYNSPDCLSQN